VLGVMYFLMLFLGLLALGLTFDFGDDAPDDNHSL
jgi:hypothetical protein